MNLMNWIIVGGLGLLVLFGMGFAWCLCAIVPEEEDDNVDAARPEGTR